MESGFPTPSLDRHNLIAMKSLSTIVGALDAFFEVAESGADPACLVAEAIQTHAAFQ